MGNGGEMKICPYNPSHHMLESVLQKHITLCDDYYRHVMEHQELPPCKLAEH